MIKVGYVFTREGHSYEVVKIVGNRASCKALDGTAKGRLFVFTLEK